MKYVHKKSDMPNALHYAAIIFSSVHIPGDERSRTNPGHGYPAEDRPIVEYIAFDNADTMQEWVEKQATWLHFVIAEISPKSIETKTTVNIS